MTKPLVPPSLRVGFTVDRETFQAVLASAFAIQQSEMDSQSLSAIVEVGRLVTSGELDVDGAMHLIVDHTRKVANTNEVASPSFSVQLPLPGLEEVNPSYGLSLSESTPPTYDAGVESADTALDPALNDIIEQAAARDAGAVLARASKLVRHSAGMSAPPMHEPSPSAVNSMDVSFEAFPVCTPPVTSAQFRLRDQWTPMLVILGIAMAVVLGWMLGRLTLLGSAHPQGPPLRFAANPNAAPAQPEEAREADPNPPPPVGQKPSRHEISPDNLVVYDHGKVVFRLKSPRARGESSAPSLALGSPRYANARLLQRVEPEYPEAAKRRRIQGLVVLEANVGKGGTIEQLTVISGNSMLASAASDAVLKWRFKPLVQNGQAVPFQTRVKVDFVLP
jgi:TonB family protein